MNETGSPQVAATKAARTRRRIMDATAHILGRRGYSGTRLAEVASETGLQAAAIYYHFTSREELVEAVIREGTTQVNTVVRAALAELPPGSAPLTKIATAVEAHLRATLGRSEYTIAAVRNSRQLPEAMRESIRADEEEYGAVWRNLIDEAHRAGRLRDKADPYLTRMLIFGALNWAVEWWRPGTIPVEEVIETAQTLIRSGIEEAAPQVDTDMPLFLEPQF